MTRVFVIHESEFIHQLQGATEILERQWQKIRGILFQEAHASRHVGTSEALSLLEKPRRDVEERPSCTARRPTLWNGASISMDVITEASTVNDIVSVIDNTCETLTSLLDAGHGYRRYYVLLLEALLKLLTTLKDVERRQPDLLRSSGMYGKLKVSVSKTYALVEKVSARQPFLIFAFKFRRLTCTPPDPVPEKLKSRVAETKALLKAIIRSMEISDEANNFHLSVSAAGISFAEAPYGITRLAVAALHSHSLLLKSGEKITFVIRDSQNKILYTVQYWLNNPESLFGSAKRLSASVESSSGKVFSIGMPGYPNKEVDLQNRTALIVSTVEQAQVKIFLPENETRKSRRTVRKPGALLEQEQASSDSHYHGRSQKTAGELLHLSKPKSQSYTGEILMSNMILKLDCIGRTDELRKLSLEGKKHKSKLWYKCCVEMTGEVLAIYRQRRRNRNQGRREEGVFHTIGMGNQPELRDLIISSFVAMGLNSSL